MRNTSTRPDPLLPLRVIIYGVFIIFHTSVFCQQNIQVDILDALPPSFASGKEVLTYKNKSILSCGAASSQTVFTLTDVEVLLSLSNMVFAQKISLTTSWNDFSPPAMTTRPGQEPQMGQWPADVQRIVFVCLAWNESNRLGLFKPSEDVLRGLLKKAREQRPWKTLSSAGVVHKIDTISDESMLLFIEMLVRTNSFLSSRGEISKNQSLWYVPIRWL